MFDNIGSRVDPERRRRDATSLGMTITLAALVGFVGGITALNRVQAPAPAPEVEMVMVDLVEQVAPPGPEDLPPAPAAPAAARGTSEPVDHAPPQPDQPVDVPPPLQPIVDTVRSALGTPDGDPLGTGDIGDGGTGATGTGGGGGGGGDCVEDCDAYNTTQHVAESRFLAQPRYPSAAQAMNLGEQVCVASVALSVKGTPESVRVSGCPEVFHPAVREAMLRSRWYPVKAGRDRIRATTTVAVRFVLR